MILAAQYRFSKLSSRIADESGFVCIGFILLQDGPKPHCAG
jgi:hypothetical protein